MAHQPYLWTGTSQYGTANRLSYVFDFKGPSVAADGACASSIVAIHLACQALRERRVNLALSGAANVLLSAEEMVIASRMRALSPDGRCKTFDASGDGYGRGEGAGMLVLRRLSDALSAGDRVLGIIRGTATNHGGHASGFTVPSATAQANLVQEALERSRRFSSRTVHVLTNRQDSALMAHVQALPGDIGAGQLAGVGVVEGDSHRGSLSLVRWPWPAQGQGCQWARSKAQPAGPSSRSLRWLAW